MDMIMMWTTHLTHTHTGKKNKWVTDTDTQITLHTHKYRPFLCIISRAISMNDGVITLTTS